MWKCFGFCLFCKVDVISIFFVCTKADTLCHTTKLPPHSCCRTTFYLTSWIPKRLAFLYTQLINLKSKSFCLPVFFSLSLLIRKLGFLLQKTLKAIRKKLSLGQTLSYVVFFSFFFFQHFFFLFNSKTQLTFRGGGTVRNFYFNIIKLESK